MDIKSLDKTGWLKKHEQHIAVFFAALAGMLIFIYLHGIDIINPRCTDWIFTKDRDLGQHYLGWAFYRNADWAFPIGLMDTLGYPHPTSVLYLDAIPLFAVFFKILSPILPDTFQYLGLWGLLCYMLQGALGAAICGRFTRSGLNCFLGSLLFINSPILIQRMFYHTALASHWVILLALLILLYHDKVSVSYGRSLLVWAFIAALSAGIHQYYLLFCGVFCFAYSIYEIVVNKRRYGFLTCIAFIAAGLLVDYALGAFSVDVGIAAGGLGEYSFNLNAFFNPHNDSRLFGPLPMFAGQYEGYAYLGAGVFALFLIALLGVLVDYQTRPEGAPGFAAELREKRLHIAVFGGICLIFTVLALSPKATVNQRVLYELQLPELIQKLWGVFRSTGRLIWPVCYIITATAVMWCVRHQKRTVATVVLALCVLLQIYDLGPNMERRRDEYVNAEYTNQLSREYWDALAEDGQIEHLVVSNSIDGDEFQYALAELAAGYAWTLNNFYFSRSVAGVYESFTQALEHPMDDTIVLVKESEFEWLSMSNFEYLYCFDGLVIASSCPRSEILPMLDHTKYVKEIQILRDDGNMDNAEDIGATRYIYPQGKSYGPYVFLPAGEYKVVIKGTNLELAAIDCVSEYGKVSYEILELKQTESEISYRFKLDEPTNGIELRVFNPSAEETITITAFTLS